MILFSHEHDILSSTTDLGTLDSKATLGFQQFYNDDDDDDNDDDDDDDDNDNDDDNDIPCFKLFRRLSVALACFCVLMSSRVVF